MRQKKIISGFDVSKLTRGAMLASVIFVMTWVPKIPYPLGYVHLGDGAVFLSAALLPSPWAVIVAAVGSGIADLASGYPMWILPTAVIKAAMTLAFTSKENKLLSTRNYGAAAIGIIINTVGYYLFGSVIYGNFSVCLPEIPANLIQAAVGAVLFVAVGMFLDSNAGICKILRGR